MTLLLFILGIIYVAMFVTSLIKVRQGTEEFGFIYQWAFWVGAFVWEDLMVFSAYHALVVLVTFLVQDLRVGLLMVGIFWVVRSSGEALYFFLQQFHMPKHHPHNLSSHFHQLEKIFGKVSDQKGYILMQIFHQSAVMFAASGVALLCLHWNQVISWF
jgi:hypothetical protein